jgi:gliding motility-associated-like protein
MKSVRTFFLLIISFFTLNKSHSQILDIGDTLSIEDFKNLGLAAYYPFDGDVKDYSANNNDGVIKGSPSLTADRLGNTNACYNFNGNGDYIRVEHHPTLQPQTAVSVSAWVNADDFNSWLIVVCKRNRQLSSPGNSYLLYASGSAGQNQYWGLGIGSSSTEKYAINSSVAKTQQWVHLVGTYDKNLSDSNMKLYINASLASTQKANYDIAYSDSSLRIGMAIPGSSLQYFKGKIDEVRIHNRALCEREVKVLYGTRLPISATSAPKICYNTSTTLKLINPQPFIKYQLHKASDSSLVGMAQFSLCSDSLYFYTGNLTQNTSFIFKAIDTSNNQAIYLDTTITVLVHPQDSVFLDTSLCGSSSSVFFNGQMRTDTGTYVGSFKNTTGCDSIVYLHISKSGPQVYNQSNSICSGDSILLAGAYRKTAGNYYDTFTRAGNCDSVINHKLSILNTGSSYQSHNICIGDSVKVNNKYYKTQGIYNDTLTTSMGCDSLLTIEIVYNQTNAATKQITICSNDSLKISSKYYKISGSYTDTVYVGSCVDSLNTIILSVVNSQLDSTTIDICEGDTVVINNKKVATAGIYYDSLKNKNGCDSIVKTTVVVHNKAIKTFTFRFCYTDSVFYGGNVYHTDTIFYDTLSTSFGCDSIVVTVIDAGGLSPNIVDSAFFCDDKTTTIDAGEYKSYQWSDGSNNRYFSTTTPGIVWVALKDSFNCTFTDTTVFVEKCSPQVYIPTSFSPNGDGKNDFLIFSAYNVDQIEFKVFDRWGEVVFETVNKDIFWDGTYKGEALPIGLYHWIVNYRGQNINGKTEIKIDSGMLFIFR